MDIYKEAVELWGIEKQMDMLSEECGELVAEINRFKRNRVTVEELCKEMADVQLMLNQMKYIFTKSFDKAYDEKKRNVKNLIIRKLGERKDG